MSVLTTRKRKPESPWRNVGLGFLLGAAFVLSVAYLLVH